jgi:hypothetical protein
MWQAEGGRGEAVAFMARFRVHRLRDWIVALCDRARRPGHGSAVLRRTPEKARLVTEHREMVARLRDRYGTFCDSATLIREDRDARG